MLGIIGGQQLHIHEDGVRPHFAVSSCVSAGAVWPHPRSTLRSAHGFVGVLLIARPFSAGTAAANIEGVLSAGIGSLCVGASFVYVKKFILPLQIPVSALITYQLGLSLVILSITTSLDGIGNVWSDIQVAAGVVLGLGLLGTGVVYIIYYYIIENLGAVSASSVAYIPPVVAIIIGVVAVGE